MGVRAFMSWISAPKCLFLQGLEGLPEVFEPWTSSRMTPGCPRDIHSENFLFVLLLLCLIGESKPCWPNSCQNKEQKDVQQHYHHVRTGLFTEEVLRLGRRIWPSGRAMIEEFFLGFQGSLVDTVVATKRYTLLKFRPMLVTLGNSWIHHRGSEQKWCSNGGGVHLSFHTEAGKTCATTVVRTSLPGLPSPSGNPERSLKEVSEASGLGESPVRKAPQRLSPKESAQSTPIRSGSNAHSFLTAARASPEPHALPCRLL